MTRPCLCDVRQQCVRVKLDRASSTAAQQQVLERVHRIHRQQKRRRLVRVLQYVLLLCEIIKKQSTIKTAIVSSVPWVRQQQQLLLPLLPQ